MASPRVFVGVLQLDISIPGARSKKDRRQVVRSVVDKVRHRFSVSANELDADGPPGRCQVVFSTAGGDPAPIRSLLQRIESTVESGGHYVVVGRCVDVFRWEADPLAQFLQGTGDE